MNEIETTYRLIVLGDRTNVGQTALTPELAKLAPGDLIRGPDDRLGLERTDWAKDYGKPKNVRTVLIEAETSPGEWIIGAEPQPRESRLPPRKPTIDHRGF
jgi:hypothetical protein